MRHYCFLSLGKYGVLCSVKNFATYCEDCAGAIYEPGCGKCFVGERLDDEAYVAVALQRPEMVIRLAVREDVSGGIVCQNLGAHMMWSLWELLE